MPSVRPARVRRRNRWRCHRPAPTRPRTCPRPWTTCARTGSRRHWSTRTRSSPADRPRTASPPSTNPPFLKVAYVDFLADAEAVLALTLGGETRGYPVQILTYHEIVNDTVDGVPVAVTYCPLCNSGLAFERQVGDRLLSFGTSGRPWSNNLVMYDRQTESLWPQLSFTASIGVLTGTKLVPHLTSLLAWSEFRQAHPDAWVLSRDTGHQRPYGRNPYLGYDRPDGRPLFG